MEPIYFIKSGDKYTWTIVPSFSIGKGVKMIEEQLGQSYGETYRYIKVGEYTYFKGGCLTGAHRVMCKTFQIGIEIGLYFANNDWDDYFERNYYLGREVKCLISYQFLKPII